MDFVFTWLGTTRLRRREVLSKDKALGISKRQSSTPNCFVVVRKDTDLLRTTQSENSSASGSDSDTCSSITQRKDRKAAPAKMMKKATNQRVKPNQGNKSK